MIPSRLRSQYLVVAMFDVFCYTVICLMSVERIFSGWIAQNNADAPERA